MKGFLATFAAALGLVGCMTVPKDDPQRDALLKKFEVAPDEAGIYVYRNEFMGWIQKMDVAVDGTPLGQTSGLTYLYTPVAPGRHVVSARAENTDTLEVEVAAGTLAYIVQEIKMGAFHGRVKLHRVDEAVGRQGVLETQLAASTPTVQILDVRVAADDPNAGWPLECQAANPFGNWRFLAPGSVAVRTSLSPLRIICKGSGSSVTEQTVSRTLEKHGTAKGAALGAGAGLALGVASAPVMGPAFAAALGLGATAMGAQVGGLVEDVAPGDRMLYPNPIVVDFRRASPAGETGGSQR